MADTCFAADQFVPTPLTIDEGVQKLKNTLLKDIRRSAYLYRVDCGGCNGCEIEIFASITSLFDAERFGIKNTPSPRHADILIFTGSVTRMMRTPAIRAYEAAPDPKIVVSYGACGCGGGIFHDLYCVWGGTDKILPVDVYIPGCPPTPSQTIYGLAMALGILGQKLKATTYSNDDEVKVVNPNVSLQVRVPIEREARRLAGYRQGRHISEHLLKLIENSENEKMLVDQVVSWLTQAGDPRLQEIVTILMDIALKNLR